MSNGHPSAAQPSKNPSSSPSAFMRARRPHQYSDTQRVKIPTLSKEVFGHCLETITSKKQEYAFEYFCRKLAQKEICPNLMPQTGPTGGGDGKVDTETYPVDELVSETWYHADGHEAAKEKWAFAISAKKKWRPKAKEDIEKIIGTNRGYQRIYFMSNQYISSREQAEIRDAYAPQGVDVRFLDRTWIEEAVFDHNRINLAVETLGLSAGQTEDLEVLGPQDTERRNELQELEAHLEDAEYYNGALYQKVEDALQAALLACGLELPRGEVDGRFMRAQRLADRYGHRQQKLRVLYKRAWTAFYWFDDAHEVSELYDSIAALATGTDSVEDLEKLANIWSTLHTGILMGLVEVDEAVMESRETLLRGELERIAAREDRPNAALWAKHLLLTQEIKKTVRSGEDFIPFIPRFRELFEAGRKMADFPMQTTVAIYEEMGHDVDGCEEYDEVLDLAASILGSRNQESTAGKMFLERGLKKVRTKHFFEAIKYLGKAQTFLGKEEAQGAFRAALVACSDAYEKVGLLWAARTCMLAAANQLFADYWGHAILHPLTINATQIMIHLEMKLGRIWNVLSWMELGAGVAAARVAESEKREAFRKNYEHQDRVLGILILKSPLSDLKRLETLPALLERHGLQSSYLATMFALGQVETLRKNGDIPAQETTEGVLDFFQSWIQQPAAQQVAALPEYFHGPQVPMKTILMGCHIEVSADSDSVSVEIGETILSALEAFLATSVKLDVMCARPRYQIRVEQVPGTGDPKHQVLEDGDPQDMTIQHHGSLRYGTPAERKTLSKWVFRIVSDIVARIVRTHDFSAYLEQLAEDEAVMGRTLNFVNIGTAIYNIFGAKPKRTMEDWLAGAELERHPLLRQEPWFGRSVPQVEGAEAIPEPQGPFKFQVGEPPISKAESPRAHQDMVISPVVNVALWDRAGWSGIMVALATQRGEPPVLGIAYRDEEAGKAIFKEWNRMVGQEDKEELLDITLITGISRKKPNAYRMVVSTNMAAMKVGTRFFTATSRIKTGELPSGAIIPEFKRQVEQQGFYLLAPVFPYGGKPVGDPTKDGFILKRAITILPAWQIDENNPLLITLKDEDDVFIPEKEKDPPILKALERSKALRSRRPG